MERQRNAAARASWISARFIEPYNRGREWQAEVELRRVLKRPWNLRRPARLSRRIELYAMTWRRAMAQVITRCRLTSHFMFMGMEADPKDFLRSAGPFARKFCPFCCCEHLWYREDSKFLSRKTMPQHRVLQAS